MSEDRRQKSDLCLRSDEIQLVSVLVIEDCNLKFICNLMLEIWDLIVL